MSKNDWIRITISVRKTTANRVIRIKNANGLSYDALFNEYVRLKSMFRPIKNSVLNNDIRQIGINRIR